MKKIIVAVSLFGLLLGCRSGDRVMVGSGGSESPTAASALAVVAVTPSNVAAAVPLGTTLQVTFNAALDSATASQIGMTLKRGATAVPGSVAVSGQQAVFTPSAALVANTTYTATVNGANGEIYAWSFTTGTETVLENRSGSAGLVQVAANAAGRMAAVWEQYDESNLSSIYAGIYTPGQGWSQAQLIEFSVNYAHRPQVVIDDWGNVTAVWEQFDGVVTSIYANRYVVGQGWGAPTVIEAGTLNAGLPRLAVDRSGNVVAVWQQMLGTTSNIYANRFVFGVGWSGAVLLENIAGAAYEPRVAMDVNGNAVAVWRQWDGTYDSIYYNRLIPGGAWAAAGTLLDAGAGRASAAQVAIDASGNAIVVWKQNDGVNENIYANRFQLGGAWSGAALLENVAGAVDEPQLVVNSAGRALAGWVQTDGASRRLFAAQFDGSAWAAPVAVSAAVANVTSPCLGLNASGQAVALWEVDGSVYWSRFVTASGWSQTTALESLSGQSARAQAVLTDGGQALVAWEQEDAAGAANYSIYFKALP